MRRVLAATMAIAFGAGLSACGVQKDEPLTKAEFITAADAICTAFNDDVGFAYADFSEAGGEEPTLDEQNEFTRETILPMFDDFVEDLRALEPPGDDADDIDGLLDDLEAAGDRSREMTELSAEEFDPEEDPFADVDAAGKAYGFEACGSEGAN